MQTWS